MLAYWSRVILEFITMANPFIIKIIIDWYQNPWNKPYFFIAFILFAIFSLLDPILTKFSWWWYTYFETKAIRLKTKLFLTKILQKDTATYVDLGTGKILKKLSSWIEAEMALLKWLFKVFSVVVIRLTIVIVAFSIKIPFMILVLIFWLFILAIILRITSKKVVPLYEVIKDINEESGAKETTIIMEKQTINLSNKNEYEVNSLSNISKPLDILKWKADFWNSIWYEWIYLLFRVAEIGSYVMIGRLILTQQATYWDIMMYVALIWQLRWPIESIWEMYAERRKNTARYKSLQDLINTPTSIIDGKNTYKYEMWNIEVNDINFSYKEWKNIFKSFSVKIIWWKTTALVWHSWSWKSTLIKLLLRLYDVSSGEIFYDWQSLPSLKKETLYEQIAYLTQEPAIFDGTIRDNLSYAFSKNELMTDSAIWSALEKAAISSFVKELPLWLDTQLGEKWVKLSWGEKQRLAIARVFLKDPRILILDEPTSALDSISENIITHSLQELMQNRTVIIIAHRLQTVMHADNIIVLHDGNIVQQGKHMDLIKEDGIYKTLVDLQSWKINE